MNKIWLCLLYLILASLSLQIAASSFDTSSYDPMADADRNGIIDVNDLSRVGRAYGSTGLVYQKDKTAISVFNETGPIENAFVAVIERWGEGGWLFVQQVGYTNSSGTKVFTLNPNTNYTAIAWTNNYTDYNYVKFATNSFGESSAFIAILEGVKHLPNRWVSFMAVNKTTGQVLPLESEVLLYPLYYDWPTSEQWYSNDHLAYFPDGANSPALELVEGGPASHSEQWYNTKCWGVAFWAYTGGFRLLGYTAFKPDANGNANVVIYI